MEMWLLGNVTKLSEIHTKVNHYKIQCQVKKLPIRFYGVDYVNRSFKRNELELVHATYAA